MAPGSNGYVAWRESRSDPDRAARPGSAVGAIDTSNPANTTLLAACAVILSRSTAFGRNPDYAPCAWNTASTASSAMPRGLGCRIAGTDSGQGRL